MLDFKHAKGKTATKNVKALLRFLFYDFSLKKGDIYPFKLLKLRIHEGLTPICN
jgi:hypothetical protein